MTIAGWKFIEFMIWKRSYYKHVTLSVLLYDNSTGKSIYTNRSKEEIRNNLRVIFPLFDFPKYYPLFLFSGSRNGGWTVPFKVNIKLFFLCVFVFTLFCWIFFFILFFILFSGITLYIKFLRMIIHFIWNLPMVKVEALCYYWLAYVRANLNFPFAMLLFFISNCFERIWVIVIKIYITHLSLLYIF